MSNEARNSNGVRARQFSGVQKKPRKPAAPKVGKGDGKRRKAELRVVTPSHGHPGQQIVGVTFVPDLISIRPTDTGKGKKGKGVEKKGKRGRFLVLATLPFIFSSCCSQLPHHRLLNTTAESEYLSVLRTDPFDSYQSLLLPFDQFAFAELESDGKQQHLRLVFATHEVSVRGNSLRRIETAMQPMELSLFASLPGNHRSLVPEGQPLIIEIVVTEAEDAEKRAQQRSE